MTTTLTAYAGARRGNYETLPTIDVEILPDVRHCAKCEGELVYSNTGGTFGWGGYDHADGSKPQDYHPAKVQCRYCHTEDPALVKYRQHAWYDAVECARCGGVDGHAIGD